MSDVKVTVDAGVCKFVTVIRAIGQDDFMSAKLIIESNCPNVKKLAAALDIVDAVEAVSSRIIDNAIMNKCSEFISHPACPVPCALIKACEVAADLGLKKDVTIKIE